MVAPGVTVELMCTGPAVLWFLNGRQAISDEDCYRSTHRRAGEQNVTGTLTINVNNTCDAFHVYCRIQYTDPGFSLYINNITLIAQG